MELNLQNHYFNALKLRYESQIEEAKANLAAIGEHSDLLSEHDRWISQYAEAQDKLQTLMSLFAPAPNTKING